LDCDDPPIVVSTNAGDAVGIADPSYMLHQRSMVSLGRRPVSFDRPIGTEEYRALVEEGNFGDGLADTKALIVNTPENPSARAGASNLIHHGNDK
jgi:aminotransferase